MKKYIIIIGIILLGTSSVTYAAGTLQVFQGGTGATTLTGCLQGNGKNPITGTGSACGSGGSGGTGTGWASSTSAGDIHFTGNGGVGIGTLTPRGMFDIDTLETISAPVNQSAIQNTVGTNNFDDTNGMFFAWNIYAYRTVGGTRIYSTGTSLDFTEDSIIGGPYHLLLSWDAVPGAEGYILVPANDDYYFYYGDWYTDLGNVVSIAYGIGTLGTPNDSLTFVNDTPTVIPNSLGASLYVSSTTGRLISEKGADFSDSITATGATLSGALNGTTAVFSSSVSALSYSGSGASLTGIPKLASANKFTAVNLFDTTNDSGISNGFAQGITIAGSGTHLYFYNSAASANNRLWDYIVGSTNWQIRTVNDANNAAGTAFQINRSGIVPTSVLFPSTAQVGIGTSTPWGGAVSASSTTATPTLVVEQKSTGQSAVFQGGAGVAIGTTTTAGEDFAVYDSAAQGTISLAGLTGGEFKIAQGGIISNGYMGISYTNPKLGLTRSGSPNFLFWYNTSTGDVAMNNTFGGSSKLQLKYGDVEALAIDSGRDVGIGSSTPFARLSVTGAGTGTGKSVIVEDSAGRDLFQINDNGNVKIGSSTPTTSLLDVDGVISSGADGNIGGGEVRAYQTPGFFVTMKHDSTYNLSGFFRSNTSGSKVIAGYNTSSGDTVLNSAFSATGNLMFTNLDVEMARFRTGMFSIGAGKFPAHTLDVTQPAISTAKTAAYDAIKASNTATSSTASVNKAGIEIVSTGTWNGSGAKNIGVYVSSVSGGTENYDAIFNGGGHVGIGTTTPQTDLVIQGYTQSVIASGVATSTCNTAIEGSQVYNLGNHHLWLCMGSEPWTLLK